MRAGREVPTHYEIDGTTLVQVIDHRGGDWQYGITADPNWWRIGKCTAAITWVVGSSIFAASKMLKVRGAIKALGGVGQTARLLVGATSRAEEIRVLDGSFAGAAGYFLGIGTIRSNC